jgi:transposase InsO family protein
MGGCHSIGSRRGGVGLVWSVGSQRHREDEAEPGHPVTGPEGKVYCAVVLDSFSRRVVGWSIDTTPTAALVTNALGMAIDRRIPPTGAIVHSDQGGQFASWAFTRRARDSGLVPSMGSVGDCYDNAMIEAFWSRMQVDWHAHPARVRKHLHRGMRNPATRLHETRGTASASTEPTLLANSGCW